METGTIRASWVAVRLPILAGCGFYLPLLPQQDRKAVEDESIHQPPHACAHLLTYVYPHTCNHTEMLAYHTLIQMGKMKKFS